MSHPIRVLVVHGDHGYANTLLEQLRLHVDLLHGLYVLPEDASGAAGSPFDAAFLDLEAPREELMQVASQLRRANPDITLVGVASRVEDAVVALAETLEMSSLVGAAIAGQALATLVLKPSRRRRFAGTVGDLSTASLFRLYGVARMDGVLSLSVENGSEGRRGLVQLEQGQPVHATDGIRVGASAILEMLTWTNASVRWLPGGVPGRRTILGRWEGLLSEDPQASRPGVTARIHSTLASESPEVLEKLTRLAQTPDVLAAFLLHRREIVTGRSFQALDPAVIGPSLVRLAQVLADLAATDDDREIQATVAGYRLVVDRVGPPQAEFQLGVVVRQAAPICKSLRRLLRQVDRAFEAADAVRRIGMGEASAALTGEWAAVAIAP